MVTKIGIMSTANFVGKNLGLAKMIFTLDIVPLI